MLVTVAVVLGVVGTNCRVNTGDVDAWRHSIQDSRAYQSDERSAHFSTNSGLTGRQWWRRQHLCTRHAAQGYGHSRTKARFPLLELTARVDGRPVSTSRVDEPLTRLVETGRLPTC